uniref:uncharacterized protein isoform X2 n=1 Tax=Semicossyphus pulcher TaxID=241346 RepID=UPI0037E9C8D2
MTSLWEVINGTDQCAAGALEDADLVTDSDIQLLTPQDLQELFPGVKNIKRRRKLYEIIHKEFPKPINQLITKLKDIVPEESFRAALENDGALVEYHRILKDLETQINYLQRFLNAQSGVLEQESGKGSLSDASTSGSNDPVGSHGGRPGGLPQGAQGEVMTSLWEVINGTHQCAASALKEADLVTDSDIQLLTPQDLQELFPGVKNIKRRRKLYEIIHKEFPKPINQLITKLKDIVPEESFRAALENDGALVEYHRILKDLETQINYLQRFLNAQSGVLEQESGKGSLSDASTSGSNDPVGSHSGRPGGLPQGAQGEVMSTLFNAIKGTNCDAASVLKKADLLTDSDIQLLTREELNELFPGPEKLKLRRKLYEIIHKKPINQLTLNLKDGYPEESFRAAFENNGVSVTYIPLLKDFKTEMSNVQSCVDAQIHFLEQDPGKGSLSDASTSGSNDAVGSHGGRPGGLPQGAQVKYKIVVSGQTFGAHLQFMEKLRQLQNPNWLVENNDDNNITILFCVISSRIGADVAAAMTKIKDNKPIILVLMHHLREARVTTPVRTWAQDVNDADIKLHVSVFYHETVPGLLKCKANDDAVFEIRNHFLKYCPQISKDTSGQSGPAAGAGSGATDGVSSSWISWKWGLGWK